MPDKVTAYTAPVTVAPFTATVLRAETQTALYAKPAVVEHSVAGISTIAAGTTIVGTIRSKGDLNILGDVQGNVETTGTVSLSGKVVGDVTGRDINLKRSTVKGNIVSSGYVQFDGSTTVVGNVTAKSVSCNGHVKGNFAVDGKAHFLCGTILVGDVCAGSLVIEEGARINGDLSTANQKDIDIEDTF